MRVVAALTIIFFLGCSPRRQHTPSRAFYHWKTIFRPTAAERAALRQLNANTLYLKVFDVEWSISKQAAVPAAQARIADSLYLRDSIRHFVPVVFITNEVLAKIDPDGVDSLASQIVSLKNALTEKYIHAELQIDCDWTAGTKEKYFALLRSIKAIGPKRLLSATIRLHQIKFSARTGVPPVDRGMLMCYNMGNLRDPASKNSILEQNVLENYARELEKYPLPLDVVYGIFDWSVIFRNGRYAGLTTYADSSRTDRLLRERNSGEEIADAAHFVNKKINPGKVALYHLDEVFLKKYSIDELETIFRGAP